MPSTYASHGSLHCLPSLEADPTSSLPSYSLLPAMFQAKHSGKKKTISVHNTAPRLEAANERSIRATVFFGVQSLAWAAGIISQPLLVTLRHRDPWLAVYAGLAMICACAALVLFLPATRDAASLTGTSCVTEESSSTSSTWATNWYARVKSATRPLWTTARWILLDNKTLGAVLLGVLFVNMSALSPSTAYRYALERFDWSRERVSILLFPFFCCQGFSHWKWIPSGLLDDLFSGP